MNERRAWLLAEGQLSKTEALNVHLGTGCGPVGGGNLYEC